MDAATARAGSHADAAGIDAGDDRQAITIRFKGKLGAEDLECGRTYAAQGADKVDATPRDFRFFVSDIRLLTHAGEQVPLRLDRRASVQTDDVALIDLTGEGGSCGAGTSAANTTVTGSIPRGEYIGIVFTNGVPNAVNHGDIARAEPPLEDVSTFWGWTNGYRFIMAELETQLGDADGGNPLSDPEDADGGSGVMSGTSLLHVGAAGCKGSPAAGYVCARPNLNRIRLEGFDPEADTIVADLAKVFENVALSVPVACHGADVRCATAYAALGLNPATGTPTDGQTVFRVE